LEVSQVDSCQQEKKKKKKSVVVGGEKGTVDSLFSFSFCGFKQ
jgi:hypothetical protein